MIKAGGQTPNFQGKTIPGYRQNSLDIVAETERKLEAAQQVGSVFIQLSSNTALREAEAVNTRRQNELALGALDGAVIALKDIFDREGERTTAGSKLRRFAPLAGNDSAVVSRLSKAGAIILGRANLSEFAFSGLGINPHYGTPYNPFDLATPRIPGGSSSGCAVAVALGLADIGIGTDTSGSIRVPAALNGLVGYRPSKALIPNQGVFPLSPSLDTVGAIARTVGDAVIAVETMANKSISDLMPQKTRELSFVIPQGIFLEDLSLCIEKATNSVEAIVKDAGVKVEVKPVQPLEAAFLLFKKLGTLVGHEAETLHGHLLNSADQATIDPVMRRRLELHRAAKYPPNAMRTLCSERLRLQIEFEKEFTGQIIMMPTTPQTAPELEPLLQNPDELQSMNSTMLRNTMVGSFLDCPSIALPVGQDKHGLPVSMQLMAPSGHDQRLIAAALAFSHLLGLKI